MKKGGIVLLVLIVYLLNYNWQPIQKEDYIPSVLTAEIKGAVNQPGVYEIKKDTSIADLIEMADGCVENADLSSLNLNHQVLNQSVLVIPLIKEGKVSLNSATLEELMTIKGVGESKAKLIIEYRETNHGFKTIEEIMNIKGIGEKTFEKIKDQLAL